MATSFYSRLVPPFDPETVRLRLRVLLFLGITQALIFLWLPLSSYYGGERSLPLPVQVTGAFDKIHPQLYQRLSSPAGSFVTGTTGELSYQVTSLWDYVLFYSFNGLTVLDTLFVLGCTLYLWRALHRLPVGRELSGRVSQAFAVVGSAAMLMFVVRLMWSTYLFNALQAHTHGLFRLLPLPSAPLYVVFGSILLLGASFLELGQRVQQDAELTI